MKIDMILLFIIAAFVAFTFFSRNIVHSLVSLVGAFFFSGALLVWMGLDFVGHVLIIVCVGPIAILLLFEVMTLDVQRLLHVVVITLAVIRESYARPSRGLDYVPHVFSLALTAGVFKIVYESVKSLVAPANLGPIFDAWVETFLSSNDLASLFPESCAYQSLDVSVFPLYVVSGLLLLLAMMGAVFLLQSQREQSR
uniref:NADH-ubiquinone oxidoreductase chain 6 n=1 Tax=Lotharella oceanica TaxID=641309 RepID=A0A140GYR9_9EUKA|nr:NADH dehydrogenase subunit 6 [Lotharella oceanica]AMN87091.1 NADH dehydrogenase subunit 6 [Lotharella oceanica]